MIREPLHSGVEARRGDVRFDPESCELFAVAEDAKAQRLILDGIDPLIFVGKGQKVCDLKHVATVGYFTDAVNGFLTDAL